MATKAVDINFVFDYVPIDQQGSENPTVYRFRQMDSRLKAHVLGRLGKERASADGMFLVAIDLFASCVIGITNFFNTDGSPVEIKTTLKDIAGRARSIIVDDVLDRIPDHIFMEMFDQIFEKSGLSGDDKKN